MSPAGKVSSYTPSLFEEETSEAVALTRASFGTFQDSLRAPVHRWFTYPAGFSYKAVEEAFRLHRISAGMTIYDPFAGTGTTNIAAKQNGIHSFGVEAHPFVQFVSRTKIFWEFDLAALRRDIDELIDKMRSRFETTDAATIPVEDIFPELVCKCYSREKLARLYLCREEIASLSESPFRDFAKLALTNLLRRAADVATGWPYVAPQKPRTGSKASGNANILAMLRDLLYQMHGDLEEIRRTSVAGGRATLINGDARKSQEVIESDSIDLAFTSPPYLNNYDYADRTRLETYFWGETATWGDITEKVRRRLMMSATTQINRSDYDESCLLNEQLCEAVPQVARELKEKVNELSKRRLTKGGKKSYDIMVAGYFNDMQLVIEETFRTLKRGSAFMLILGDSAPYGVYIPTDGYLGEIGKASGFARYEIEELRTRGGKWKNNPQRHDESLKECILTLFKD